MFKKTLAIAGVFFRRTGSMHDEVGLTSSRTTDVLVIFNCIV